MLSCVDKYSRYPVISIKMLARSWKTLITSRWHVEDINAAPITKTNNDKLSHCIKVIVNFDSPTTQEKIFLIKESKLILFKLNDTIDDIMMMHRVNRKYFFNKSTISI